MEQLKGKRIVWSERGKVLIESFKVREPKAKEVLIRTRSTLISPGTEGAFLMALPNTPGKFPQYPGYSNAGKIIRIGSKVSKLKVGDRVVSRASHANYVLVPEERVLKIPQGLSFDKASFFSLSSIALQGIRKAKIELGDSVVVLGQGPVGQLALQFAKLSGAIPLVGVDLYDNRLDISSRGGANYTLNPRKINLGKKIKEITKGKGVKIVIEATGSPEAIPLSFELASRLGRVILLASTRGESKINFYSQIHKKGVVVIGAHNSIRPKYESSYGRWTLQDDSELVLNLLTKGLIIVKDLISLKLNFKKASEAYRKIIEDKKNTLDIILDWT